MFLCTRLAALLLCAPLAAYSQTCSDALRQAARQENPTVSARNLAIPEKAWKHFDKARIALDQNRADVVDAEVAKAIAIVPNFGDAWLLRAVAQLNLGNNPGALDLVATAQSIQPGLHWASIVNASALNSLRRFAEASTELEKVNGPEAHSWQASYEHARAETGLLHPGAALRWSELAVAAAPAGCTAARLVRANALHLVGRTAEIVAELQAYLVEDRLKTRTADVVAAIERVRAEAKTPGENLIAMK